MRKKSKKQNSISETEGITLIALIITIIVMLILAAAAITSVINGGLFEYTRKATIDTKNEINNELTLSEGIIGGKTIDEIVADYTNKKSAITLSATNISYDDFVDSGSNSYLYALTATVDESYSTYSISWEMNSPNLENLFFDQTAGNYATIECKNKIRYGDITITANIEGTDQIATCILDTSAGTAGPVI